MVFMLAIKTQFASTHNDGLINLMGAISFSLGLVLVVLTHSELLTSNFMFNSGWYYKVISMKKVVWIFIFCFIGNIIGGFILFFLMKFSHVMTPEMTDSLTTSRSQENSRVDMAQHIS